MPQQRPYTEQDLNPKAKAYCAILRNRVKRHRCSSNDAEFSSTRNDRWDIPRVAAACGTTTAPFLCATGRNSSFMKQPNMVLEQAYQNMGVAIGERPQNRIPGGEYFKAGQCAEPHAANRLLNDSANRNNLLTIGNLVFSKAYKVKNGMVRPYCETCRLVFPQL